MPLGPTIDESNDRNAPILPKANQHRLRSAMVGFSLCTEKKPALRHLRCVTSFLVLKGFTTPRKCLRLSIACVSIALAFSLAPAQELANTAYPSPDIPANVLAVLAANDSKDHQKGVLHIQNDLATCRMDPEDRNTTPETVAGACSDLSMGIQVLRNEPGKPNDELLKSLATEFLTRSCALGGTCTLSFMSDSTRTLSFLSGSTHKGSTVNFLSVQRDPAFQLPKPRIDEATRPRVRIDSPVNVDAAVIRASGVPLLPLVPVPPPLQDYVVKQDGRDLRDFRTAIFSQCAADRGSFPDVVIGSQCDALANRMAEDLNWDGNVDKQWLAKHNLTKAAQNVMDSARMRSCAIGNGDGCKGYALTLRALGNPEAADLIATMADGLLKPDIVAARDKALRDAHHQASVEQVAEQEQREQENKTSLRDVLSAVNTGLGAVNDTLAQNNATQAANIAHQQQVIDSNLAAGNARRAQQAEAQREAAAHSTPQPHAAAATASTPPSTYSVDYGTGPGSYPNGSNSASTAPANSLTNSKPASDYAGSMDHCVSMAFLPASFNGMPSDMYLTFTNHCPSTVYIKYFIGQQSPAGTTVASEDAFNATGWTESAVTNLHQGSVGFYACPTDHPKPVDAKGNDITTRGAAYQCAKSY